MGYEGPTHRAKYDAVDSGPIRYIIFTQGHVDHVGGAESFLEEGTKMIAHEGNQRHQALDRLIQGYRMRHAAFAFPELRQQLEKRASVDAKPLPQAVPTPDMNLVTIRGDKYRESGTFLAAIERVRALEPEILALGHHAPLRGAAEIRWQLDRLHAAVRYVHDETVRYMNEGKDVHTAMAEIELPPELEVGQGCGKVAWNVRAIWESYVGWFHHLSTTELYAAPPASVHPDLVALAGREAVIGRARERLERGEAVEAIHLAEVVLNAHPDDDAVTRKAITELHRQAFVDRSERDTIGER